MSVTAPEEDLELGDLFPEPPRPPSPEPSTSVYDRKPRAANIQSDWNRLEIRLVGGHPLWGHYLWNAARVFADYLDENSEGLCRGKNVLELGAGGGLPGLVCALDGATKVVLTDYPDADLLRNLEINVKNNISPLVTPDVSVQGHLWGSAVQGLRQSIDGGYFDLIILSDLVFNHSQHDALLRTCDGALSPTRNATPSDKGEPEPRTPCCLVFYTHHRPHLAERDLNFFRKACEQGWRCKEIVTKVLQPMFPDDPGDEAVRATVHGWIMERGEEHVTAL